MSTRKLTNITPVELQAFLETRGCKCTRTTGGHEHWTRSDLSRPLTFSSYITPEPIFVINNLLRLLGLGVDDFFEYLVMRKIDTLIHLSYRLTDVEIETVEGK